MKGSRKQPTPAQLIDGLPKEYRQIARVALEAGWSISRSGNGHTKLSSPDRSTTMPLPGSGRVATGLHKRIVSQLRKAGLDL